MTYKLCSMVNEARAMDVDDFSNYVPTLLFLVKYFIRLAILPKNTLFF